MDADSGGEADGGDFGDIGDIGELNDEEQMAKFLEDVIGGEVNEEEIEAFRSSEVFEDFIKELSIGNNDSRSSLSRRPSLETEREGKRNSCFAALSALSEQKEGVNIRDAKSAASQSEKCDRSRWSATSSSKKRRKLSKKKNSNSNTGRYNESHSDSSYCEDDELAPTEKVVVKDLKMRDKLKISLKPTNSVKKNKQSNKLEKLSSEKTSRPGASSFTIKPATKIETAIKKTDAQPTSRINKKDAISGGKTLIRPCSVILCDLVHLAKVFSKTIEDPFKPELVESIRKYEQTLRSKTTIQKTPHQYWKPNQNHEHHVNVTTTCNSESSPPVEKKTLLQSSKNPGINATETLLLGSSYGRPIESPKKSDVCKTTSRKTTDNLKNKSSKQHEEVENMSLKESHDERRKEQKISDDGMMTSNKAAKKKPIASETSDDDHMSVDKPIGPDSVMPTLNLAGEGSLPCPTTIRPRQSSPPPVLEEDITASKTPSNVDFQKEVTVERSTSEMGTNSGIDKVASSSLSPKEISTDEITPLENLEMKSAAKVSPPNADDTLENPPPEIINVSENVERDVCNNNTTTEEGVNASNKKEDEVGVKETEPVEVNDSDDNEADYEPHMPSEELPSTDIRPLDAVVENYESSPDKEDDGQRSPSPERIVSVKKKKFIESSSDDGDNVRKEQEDFERKKSSDEENYRSNGKKVSFERKKDAVDYRSKKFDELQNERQRKLSEKKKEKEKSKEFDALEEIFKEKTLTGSFRIPKKTSGHSKQEKIRIATPLAVTEAPKENLQFERFRKGQEKEKTSYIKEYNNDLYLGPTYSNRDRGVVGVGATAYDKNKDDTRVRVLIPEKGDLPVVPPLDESESTAEVEPVFNDEPAGGDFDDDNDNDDGNNNNNNDDSCKEKSKAQLEGSKEDTHQEAKDESVENSSLNETIKKENVENQEENENDEYFNPLVPLKEIKPNEISIEMINYINKSTAKRIELPDSEAIKDLAEFTLQKIAWWFGQHDSNALATGDAYASDSNSDDTNSECSFLENLDLSDDSENGDLAGVDRSVPWQATNEHCGIALLKDELGKYRAGPGENFVKIFRLRTGEFNYEIDRYKQFQVSCSLCNQLVVGGAGLAAHVLSPQHTAKMSRLEETAFSEPSKAGESDKVGKSKESETTEKDKTAERRKRGSQNGELVTIKKEIPDGKNDGGKEDSKKKTKESKSDRTGGREKRSEKRKHSKDRRSSDEKSHDSDNAAEIGVTSTGLPIKIPASAIPPERKRSRSRDRRSRSPRQKRDRSRSSHQRASKSPRKKSRSPQRRRKSRSPITRVQRERIPRSPSKARENRENRERKRSTSAERVEKFLAKTNRRSRSPSNGHVRKRHRRSRSKSPTTSALPKRDNREFHEKLALTAEGKWTDEMESRWKLMEVDEAMFLERFGERQKLLKETPEKHENYGTEWSEFWERRFQEVEQEGKDPEKYDYVPEWKEFWTKRLKELLVTEFDDKRKEIKRQHGMDFDTLQKLRSKPDAVPTPPPTVTPHQVPPPNIMLHSHAIPSPHIGLITPQPVPLPQFAMTPQMVPPPQVPVVLQVVAPLPVPSPKAASVVLASGSISGKSATSDDITARSMSISEGGSDEQNNPAKIPTKPVDPVTTGDVMSLWDKITAAKPSASGSAAGVTRQTSQPNQNIDSKSSTDSGSIASYDFNGYDIPQALWFMSQHEEQLSFLVNKVQEYTKKAEEMELKKSNGAKKLLDDEEFVSLIFQVRDRCWSLIRANILPADIMRKINSTLHVLDGMMYAPQCLKHRSKLQTAAAANNSVDQNVEPEEKSEASVINNTRKTTPVSSVSVEKVTSAAANYNSSSWSQKTKEEIACLIGVRLILAGRAGISQKELQDLVRVMLSPSSSSVESPPLNIADALRAGASAANSPLEPRQPRRVESDNETWQVPDDRNMLRTHNIASSRVGSFYPSLPHSNTPSLEEEEPRVRGIGRGSGGNGRPSESLGAQPSFRGRGYAGANSTYSPYYDQDGINTESVNSTQSNISTLDAASSVVTSMLGNMQFRPIQTVVELQEHPAEISMEQLTHKEVENEVDPSEEKNNSVELGQAPGTSNNEQKESPISTRLPPGILNMIMQERKKQQPPEAGEIISEEEPHSFHRLPEREPRKRKKKKKDRKRARNHRDTGSDSVSDSDSESDYRRKRHRKRKKRRRSPSPSPVKSEKSNGESIILLRKAPPLADNDSDIEILNEHPPPSPMPKSSDTPLRSKALLQESNSQASWTYNWNTVEVTSPIASPPLSLVGNTPLRCVSKGIENSPVLPSPPASVRKSKKLNDNWDTLSEASSGIPVKKTTTAQKDRRQKKKDDTKTRGKDVKKSSTVVNCTEVNKVTSVSATFWTMNNDDAKSLCSISTNDSLDIKESEDIQTPVAVQPQLARKYRSSTSTDTKSKEPKPKEPGEISDSNSNVSDE